MRKLLILVVDLASALVLALVLILVLALILVLILILALVLILVLHHKNTPFHRVMLVCDARPHFIHSN